MLTKVCSICKETKAASEFPNNSRAKDGLYSYCTDCNRKKSLAYIRSNPEARRIRRSDVRKMMIESAQSRAKARDLEIDITYSDITVPELCPVFNKPLVKSKGKATGYSPSLDRIDNSKGYIKGNIQVLSNKANAMKANATKEELIMFAKWVLKEYEDVQSTS